MAKSGNPTHAAGAASKTTGSTPRKGGRHGPYGVGRVMFLAKLEEIKTRLESGHTARKIYEEIFGSDDPVTTYSNFARYVRRYIREAAHDDTIRNETGAGVGTIAEAKPAGSEAGSDDGGPIVASSGLGTFNFNPIASRGKHDK